MNLGNKVSDKDKMVTKDIKNNKGTVLSEDTDNKDSSKAVKNVSNLCKNVNYFEKPLSVLHYKQIKDIKLDNETELDKETENKKECDNIDPPLKKDDEKIQEHPVLSESG